MPVSHIGLTVSHLPTATSFFLAALQPLGYRYIGKSGDQVGLGIENADFFLCQETPDVKAGAAHIAFTAPSSTAVRNFYTAALNAGARPNGAPAARCADKSQFNAAVLDFDGNSIEVVYREGPDMKDDGTVVTHSRVIKWQRSSLGNHRDDRSAVSSRAAPEVPANAESVASKATNGNGNININITQPAAQQPAKSGESGTKTLIGTLLGAAAGAAVAYAMVNSERDSAKKESEFNAYMVAKDTVKAAVGHLAQASSQPQLPQPADPQPATQTAPPPQSVHRNIDAQSYYSSSPSQPPSNYAPRQIEAAPSSYYQPPTYTSVPPTQVAEPRAIEYVPAYSVAPSQAQSQASQARSRVPAYRSQTSPELLTMEKARSVASTLKPETVVSNARSSRSAAQSTAPSDSESSYSKSKSRNRAHSVAPSDAESGVTKSRSRSHAPPSVAASDAETVLEKGKSRNLQCYAQSVAPSTLISSFVPDQVERRSSAGSIQSYHSTQSKTKSTASHSSKHSSHPKHGSSRHRDGEEKSSPPPPESKAPSKVGKAASMISSFLGRDKSKAGEDYDFIDDLDIEELTEDDDDLSTVVPSDSISQIGGPPRRRKHRRRSEKEAEGSVLGHKSRKDSDSIISKQSSSSKHSKRPHHSHRSNSHHSEDAADDEDSSRARRSSRPSTVSEASDASTVRPVKAEGSGSSKAGTRKDSVTQGQYDGLWDQVQYGTGDVAVRGITPSMVSAANKNKTRTMIGFNHAQKQRVFEGASS
ncbi:predicted protein [Plenodomus lingam JN3]|uniref:Predicted protein n=2 Tax=Leptosphaeria maculans TaxID=5022 RepID=E5A3N1_LEPMJ|nr:predicted protein [Plenodomus lingam JN3]CBX98244.1 predicted protein [Plenodomus lingam JN3]